MGRLLIDYVAARPGDSRGVQQLALGPDAPLPVGAQVNYVLMPDLRGNIWPCLTAELTHAAADRFLAAGPRCPSRWPLPARNDFRTVGWDGMSSDRDALAVRYGKVTLSWLVDRSGVHVAVVPDRPHGNPDELVAPLVELGALTGWAGARGHERRWLLSCLATLAPHVTPPSRCSEDELQRGLAHLTGWESVFVMQSEGGYRPEPHVTQRGDIEFARPRPAWLPERLHAGAAVHRVSPVRGIGGVVDVVESGALLSQRRRRLLGNMRGLGRGEGPEREAGLAHYVTVDHVRRSGPVVAGFVWDDPARLMTRMQAVAMPQDPFLPAFGGRIANPEFFLDPTFARAEEAGTVLGVGVQGSLDVFGPWGPTRIYVPSEVERSEVIAAAVGQGARGVQGRSFKEAVLVDPAVVRSVRPVAV